MAMQFVVDDSNKLKKDSRLVEEEAHCALHNGYTLHRDTTATITSYQCKKSNSVNILSTVHKNVVIPEHNNTKLKPETVLFYNQTKVDMDVLY